MKNKLIDADSYLKNFCNRFCSVKECTSTQKKSCCIAISLKDEPAVENVTDTNVCSKWIPCSERLPECDTDVLICSGEFVHEACFKDEHFSNAYGMWYKAVTHWMPLPEPYKGE